jgi:hypothetical protein
VADVEEPGHIALALLDYRVGQVESRVEAMGVDLTEVARQVQDIPGFISRKFEEQRDTIAKNRRTAWDRVLQWGTLAAAVAATVAAFTKGHV